MIPQAPPRDTLKVIEGHRSGQGDKIGAILALKKNHYSRSKDAEGNEQ